jgi:hypothetical protein
MDRGSASWSGHGQRLAGVFAVNAGDDPSDSADGIGFRCAR